jgi:hypothetical protein
MTNNKVIIAIIVVVLCSEICEKLNFCVVKNFSEPLATSIFASFNLCSDSYKQMLLPTNQNKIQSY